ncbi:MAG: twin-arginine translocase TatA/TatE family subunit [Bryobacteraceae bacterium]|jgi:sec-independent protein translocase protein TatA
MGTADLVFARIFSFQDLLLVAAVALLFFGGKKIPEIAKGLGEGIRNFKDGMKADDQEKKQ